jgi:hypothetical protein
MKLVEQAPSPQDGGERQRRLRLLVVARPQARSTLPDGWTPGPLEIVPLLDGSAVLTGPDPTPERRRELERLYFELSRPPAENVSTCDTPEKKVASLRETLRTFGRRAAAGGTLVGALSQAGALYLEHGELARTVAAREIEEPALWLKVDGLLARAGLPAPDRLPGIG